MTSQENAILVGGPRDGDRFTETESPLVELELGTVVHRYIRTTTARESLTVYNYDGAVDPVMTRSGRGGEGPVQPAADEGVDPPASIEPRNQGAL